MYVVYTQYLSVNLQAHKLVYSYEACKSADNAF